MTTKSLCALLFAAILSGCGPTQKITTAWINPEAHSKDPYKSIFIMALSQSKESSYNVEDQMALTITSRGPKAVRSSDVFPPNIAISENFTREQLADAIKKTGCDAVFIIALLDVNTVEHYQPGVSYYSMNYGMHGSYYGYYNHYYPHVYSPGYYSIDKTYYIESNFYDLELDQLLWSVQSEAYNPTSLESWFKKYSYNLIKLLKEEGLITK